MVLCVMWFSSLCEMVGMSVCLMRWLIVWVLLLGVLYVLVSMWCSVLVWCSVMCQVFCRCWVSLFSLRLMILVRCVWLRGRQGMICMWVSSVGWKCVSSLGWIFLRVVVVVMFLQCCQQFMSVWLLRFEVIRIMVLVKLIFWFLLLCMKLWLNIWQKRFIML